LKRKLYSLNYWNLLLCTLFPYFTFPFESPSRIRANNHYRNLSRQNRWLLRALPYHRQCNTRIWILIGIERSCDRAELWKLLIKGKLFDYFIIYQSALKIFRRGNIKWKKKKKNQNNNLQKTQVTNFKLCCVNRYKRWIPW
jgi:hypothetical protein